MSESASSAGLWRVAVEVPAALAAAVEAVLEPHVETMAVMEIGGGTATTLAPSATTPMVVEGFTQRQPDRLVIEAGLAGAMTSGAPPVLRIEDHGERDWLAENRASFPAIDVGRFHIRGSHLGAPPPPGQTVLRVDAAAAFGSGSHATTAGCLAMLARLALGRRRRRVLDMGTGTGILALAAARLWPAARLWAVDNDADAVAMTARNRRRNAVGRRLTPVHWAGYRHPVLVGAGPFDLIVANILARPLIDMAPDLAAHLAPGGRAVLSGLLVHQERGVLLAHRRVGLVPVVRRHVDGWSTLLLAHVKKRRPEGRRWKSVGNNLP
ncbi:MAG: 50S ribosomal protein L11 methyltransferase [Pseudomonadota bacterium]|nr:50S ribosomal protein L11 methyltransferase [Pseudomonadota bacterium]